MCKVFTICTATKQHQDPMRRASSSFVDVFIAILLGLKVHIGDDEMQFGPSMIPMLDPNHGEPAGVQAGNQEIPLEAVDQLQTGPRVTFKPRRLFFGKAQDPRSVPLGKPRRIDQLRGRLRVATQQFGRVLLQDAGVILLRQQVGERPITLCANGKFTQGSREWAE
jgi:hypothetical protein